MLRITEKALWKFAQLGIVSGNLSRSHAFQWPMAMCIWFVNHLQVAIFSIAKCEKLPEVTTCNENNSRNLIRIIYIVYIYNTHLDAFGRYLFSLYGSSESEALTTNEGVPTKEDGRNAGLEHSNDWCEPCPSPGTFHQWNNECPLR